MSVTAIVGAQWGDEGKGRIVDYLAQNADLVIRFQGGDNAGHTVINSYGKFALHIIPSGIFNPDTICLVGAGTVVNFNTMKEELEGVRASGLSGDNLRIDKRAHLIMPYHCLLDGAEEQKKDAKWAIGTTKRGIGPVYADKAARIGIRAADIFDPDRLRVRLEMLIPRKNRELEFYGIPAIDIDEMMDLCASWKEEFGDKIIDSLPLVRDAVLSDKTVILEGQLGIMRDLDWGIYPYVTSSNPTAGGTCAGAGISPRRINNIYGIVKSYSTSVGGGPFPVELFDEDGEKLRSIGMEFGATTGRPRRCGWFDAVAASFSCWINGFTSIAVTKLDVLDTFERIKICKAYRVGDEIIDYVPETSLQDIAEPIYEEWEGWQCDTTGVRSWDDLPEKAKAYLERIEELTGAPIGIVSVGPRREQLLVRE